MMARELDAAPSIGIWPLQTAMAALFHKSVVSIEQWAEQERDQFGLWLPVVFGLGIALWFIVPDHWGWLGCLSGALGLSLSGLLVGYRRRIGRSIGLFGLIVACGLAAIWWRAEGLAHDRIDRPRVESFQARVVAIEFQPARERVRLLLEPQSAPGLPGRVRVNVDAGDFPTKLAAGQAIRLRARLLPPADPAIPAGYDFARVAWFQKIGATGRVLDRIVIVADPSPGGFWRRLGGLRQRLSAHIQQMLPGAGGGVASALATGDQGAIPEADADAMRRSGLAHLLSVSGLHVSAVVGGLMFFAMRVLALSPRLALRAPLLLIAAGIAALGGIGYTLLSGAEVPTIRSCIAALLVLAGIAIGREALTLRLVATGALVVMLFWPEAIAGPSFQLSFAAVTAIVALHEHPAIVRFLARREEGPIRRCGRVLLGLLLTGLVVEIALAPIALFHFHQSGLYGALANIVAIPLTTFVIMPCEALALLLDLIGIGAPLWWVIGKAIALLLGIAHAVGSAPGAVARLATMPWGAFAAIVAGGLWLALWRTRVRTVGLVPVLIGALWAVFTPPPDLLVTGDGRHVALRGDDGRMALLRFRAGDYVRDVLAEASATEAEALADLETEPHARCSADICVARIMRGGRRWQIAATRSPYLVDIRAMNRLCAEADIVISDRRLPRSCKPRWLKADRNLLRQTGGLAIRLDPPAIDSVAERAGDHPWAFRPVSSGGAAPQASPAPAPDRGNSAADHRPGSPDRGGSSIPRAGNI